MSQIFIKTRRLLIFVVNNVNMPCFVYQNQAKEILGHHYIKIKLNGDDRNTLAYGSQLKLYHGDQMQYLEYMPIRGFESSMEPVAIFGLGKEQQIDSLLILFPDGSAIKKYNLQADQTILFYQKDALSGDGWHIQKSIAPLFNEVTIPGLAF